MQNTLLYILALEIDTLQTFGLIRDCCLPNLWLEHFTSSLLHLFLLCMSKAHPYIGCFLAKDNEQSSSYWTYRIKCLWRRKATEGWCWFGTASRRNERKEKTWENSSNSFQDLDPGNGQPKVGLSFLS